MTGPKDIRALCLDVDGVLTDGRLYVGADGRPARAFHIHDGLAVKAFQRHVGPVAIITGKRSQAVAARAEEMQIRHVVQGSEDKLADLNLLLPKLEVRLDQLAAIGDDLMDLPVLTHCGYAIAVENAVDEIKRVAAFVTRRPGGAGAVREAIEHLMRASGHWREVLQSYGADYVQDSAGL